MDSYSFSQAVNHSSEFHKYYYVSECDEYLVVINHHISLWKKENGQLEFQFNLLHKYDSPDCKIQNNKFVCDESPVEIIYNFDDLYVVDLIPSLEYRRIIDLSVPKEVSEWQVLTTKALQKYDELMILSGCGDCEEQVRFFKDSIFDNVFLLSSLNITQKLIDGVDELYIEMIGTKIDSAFV